MDRGADRTFAWGSGPGCHRHTGETSGGGGHKGKDKRAGWAPPAHPSGPLRVCALNTAECEAESPLPWARLLSSLNLSFLI